MKETQDGSVPWGWWTAVALLAAHVVFQIGLTIAGLGVVALVLLATAQLDTSTLAAWATSGPFLGIVGTLGGLASLALVYGVVTHLRKLPFRATIGLIDRRWLWQAAFGAVILGGAMDAVTLALQKPLVPDVLRPAFAGAAGIAAMLVFAVLVTPLIEELLFRGLLYPVAARSLGVTGGVLLVSAVFGLSHVATYGLDAYLIAQTLLAGVYLTWLRARTGSLVPSVAAHAALNLYATLEAIVATNLIK